MEIPISYLTQAIDREAHEDEDRSVSVTEKVREGTLTDDTHPLARRKVGEDTETTYAGDGGLAHEAMKPGHGCSPAKSSRESNSTDIAEDEQRAAKQAKRQRQKERRSPEKQAQIDLNKALREYSFCLRVAYASTVLCPVQYYSAPGKMWAPPEVSKPYTFDEICNLRDREPRSETQDCSGSGSLQGPAVLVPHVDRNSLRQDPVPSDDSRMVQLKRIITIQADETLAALEDISRSQASIRVGGGSDLPDYEEFIKKRDEDSSTVVPRMVTLEERPAFKGNAPMGKGPSRASSSTQPMTWTPTSTGENWQWNVRGPAEDSEMESEEQRDAMDCDIPQVGADLDQSSYVNPKTVNRAEVHFHSGEHQPLYKNALMTTTARRLDSGIGKGLAQAEPAPEIYENTRGFSMMAKGIAVWMQKKGDKCQPLEKAEDYLKRVMDSNTPVINAAVAWGAAAEKKVAELIERTKRARSSETPSADSLDQRFTQAETLNSLEPAASRESAMSQEVRLDEDEMEAPTPFLNTAFAAEVWPRVNRDNLSATDIEREIDQSSGNPGHTGHSDVDFSGEDV